jgi:diaminohydroxyphosphoribosylaminopyrimidine deaminase / 5-amino-6-(5-phosphoribosylamino)uracil reductase
MDDRTDQDWMQMAIDLAAHRVGLTGANPAVGCVIVRAGELMAASVTAEGGRPHAEEQALAAAGSAAHGATAYVTLEPCGARTSGAASCAELLARAGVARVVIACLDASPFASGRGTEQLAAAGVAIEPGVLGEEAADLYADYPHLG